MNRGLPAELASRILVIRGQRVMIDADLAELYGVETKVFNQAIKRTLKRFPADFVFQLSIAEKSDVVTNRDHLARLRFSPHLPRAFTEHGAIMAATVLNSPQAVEMSVYVVRAFVELRSLLGSHKELATKLSRLERKVGEHDQALRNLIASLRQLTTPTASKKRPIGFLTDIDAKES